VVVIGARESPDEGITVEEACLYFRGDVVDVFEGDLGENEEVGVSLFEADF
jgi:hypothetical protein